MRHEPTPWRHLLGVEAVDYRRFEEALKRSFACGFGYASMASVVREVVMDDLCPVVEGGYRWSATSNYKSACLRALQEGRPQPESRSRNLSAEDRARIWELCQAGVGYWKKMLADVGGEGYDGTLLSRDALMAAGYGRLFDLLPGPRGRLSALAA